MLARVGPRQAGPERAWPGRGRNSAETGPELGMAPSVTRSTILYDHEQEGFLEASALLALQGFGAATLRVQGLSSADLTSLAANGMCLARLAIALTPILRALGYLEKK